MADSADDCRFPRKERLTLDRQFRRVFQEKRSSAGPCLVLYASRNELEYNRLGLVVSRQLGSAVVRNRFKRYVRESFRLTKSLQPTGWDWIVLPRLPKRIKGAPAEIRPPSWKLSTIQEELLSLMRRATRN